jgi:hypothetical protein
VQLEKIITLANSPVELLFRAMERSLRATGCNLPLWVIPFDERRFELPANAQWWEDDAVFSWLDQAIVPHHARKYLCLLTANYQFVDTDVIFLRDPAKVLAQHPGFVASCGHWHNPGDCVTPAAAAWWHGRTTRWPAFAFNAGQFACDRALYHSATELYERAASPELRAFCLDFPYHDQPGLNTLVAKSGVPFVNLTMPPRPMESTWAGDYPGEYKSYWSPPERQPYLIHWAGLKPDGSHPIDELFSQYLTPEERTIWQADLQARPAVSLLQRLRARTRAAYRAWKDAGKTGF